MKKVIILLFFIGSCFCGFAQELSYLCSYGFTFDISQQKNWGYQKPIILSVTPGSSAAKAGIRPYDIIEKIDDVSTENLPLDKVHELMHDVYKDQSILTISNLAGMKNVIVDKSCTFSHVIPEKELASSFAFYSLENIQKRSFTCPFTTSTDTTLNLLAYRTFAFTKLDENYIALENAINESLQMNLAEKGLIYQAYNPDIIIQTYYSYIPNPNYDQRNNNNLPGANRYNLNTKKMQELPIIDVLFHSSRQAPFILSLGLRFVDRKKSTPNKPVIIWECEATEYLKNTYSLEDYAKFHLPLMLVQFPYVQTKDVAKFAYNSYKYNYTGINYNLNNREHIIDVDINSPADKVGIKRGDVVRKINNIQMVANPKDAEDRYRLFIFNTMGLRDSTTQFMNIYGFARCAYWDEMKYTEIAETFKNKDYFNTFSYLFYFEPYINPTKRNIVSFDLKRGRKKMKVNIRPEVRYEESLELIRNL
jgi:hypothetical protein